jgi:hypothetical protein
MNIQLRDFNDRLGCLEMQIVARKKGRENVLLTLEK